jgi:metal transporter CNNM
MLVAALIYPLVKRHHQLLVTLLLANAFAMESLPIFLDRCVVLCVCVCVCVGEREGEKERGVV